MRSIAQAENMKFIDGSEQTRAGLESIGEVIHRAKPTGPVLNIGIEGKDGMRVTAGNLGLPTNQVALGFSRGESLPEAQKFTNEIISRLKEQWPIEILPPGENARGMKTCAEKQENTTGKATAR